MTTELKTPHPVISMSHMNIKSLTFSHLIVSTSKNETKIITSRQIVEQIQFKREISSKYTLLLWFYDKQYIRFPSEPSHINEVNLYNQRLLLYSTAPEQKDDSNFNHFNQKSKWGNLFE